MPPEPCVCAWGCQAGAGARGGGHHLGTGSGCGNNVSLAHTRWPLPGWRLAGSPPGTGSCKGSLGPQPFLLEDSPLWPPESTAAAGPRSIPLCRLILVTVVVGMCLSSVSSNDSLGKAAPSLPAPFLRVLLQCQPSWGMAFPKETPPYSEHGSLKRLPHQYGEGTSRGNACPNNLGIPEAILHHVLGSLRDCLPQGPPSLWTINEGSSPAWGS